MFAIEAFQPENMDPNALEKQRGIAARSVGAVRTDLCVGANHQTV